MIGIVEPMEIGDRRRIGQRRIAHPDPNPVIALGDRIGLDLGAARNLLLAGNAGAAAVGAEAQAVIVALQLVADELAHGQRQMAVRAAILHRHRRARSVRKNTMGSPRMVRGSGLRPTSASVAATYQ